MCLLQVEPGNPNLVWSASEDGTFRQHDFREGSSCPPAGSSHQECRNVLVSSISSYCSSLPCLFCFLHCFACSFFLGVPTVTALRLGYIWIAVFCTKDYCLRATQLQLDLRCGAKKSLADPPKQPLALKSCDISSTRPHLVIVGGRYSIVNSAVSVHVVYLLTTVFNHCSDAFARLYDRRMLPPLSSSQNKLPPPPCVDYFCPMHLSDLVRPWLNPKSTLSSDFL